MLIKDIMDSWYADLYDQEETQLEDVDFMLSVIGTVPQRILEVCCGTGRILIPLAEAGYEVVGFDMDEHMLSRLAQKAVGLENLCFSKSDAIKDAWGRDFDTVILGGNLMLNIIADMEYKEAQKLLIKKAYEALREGGHLLLDFSCFSHPERIYGAEAERIIFEGRDNKGNYGKYILKGGRYDPAEQTTSFTRRMEITTSTGELFVHEKAAMKHIPTLKQVRRWLKEAGFEILREYGDYKGNPISETTYRAILWAERRRTMEYKNIKVDLHMHTTDSDGSITVEDLLQEILKKDIKLFSVTEHDTTVNTQKVRAFAEAHNLLYINGVELTAYDEGRRHVLGYGVDPDNEELRKVMEHNKPLLDAGMEDTPHVFVTAEEAIGAITAAGGIPVLAHPGAGFYDSDYRNVINRFVGYGIKGIECRHPENDEEITAYCLELCRQKDMYITGGSDYHGDCVPSRKLGMMELELKDVSLKELLVK